MKVVDFEKIFYKMYFVMYDLDKIKEYIWLLEKWNLKINLVSYRNLTELVVNNILDSLSIMEVYDFKKDDIVADIGSGPGLPGIVLAIKFPLTRFFLIEPRKKYFMFLKAAVRILRLNNVKIIKSRIEQINDKFNVILNRAVSEINDIIRISDKNLSDNGFIFSYKGSFFYKEFPITNNDMKIKIIKKIKILEIYNKRLYIIGLKRRERYI